MKIRWPRLAELARAVPDDIDERDYADLTACSGVEFAEVMRKAGEHIASLKRELRWENERWAEAHPDQLDGLSVCEWADRAMADSEARIAEFSSGYSDPDGVSHGR